MQYLTYDEYIELGGQAEKERFTLLEFKARKRIDYLTDSRVQEMQEVPEAVKLCMTALINVESKTGLEAQIDAPVVTSFSTDGYSESYGKALGTSEIGQEQDIMIREMLYGELNDEGIPLLYRGLR